MGKWEIPPITQEMIDAVNKEVEQEHSRLKKENHLRYLNENDLEEDIEKHDTLNPLLFEDEELRPEVKRTINKIVDTFTSELADDGIKFNLKDVVLVGSNVSYNYTKDSDLDIHIIADSNGLECPNDLYSLLYSAYRSIFNKNYDIKIRGIPVEIYVELDEPAGISNGVYSLNKGWIKKPEPKAIPEIDKEAFDKAFKEWEDRYNALINTINEEYSDDIYNFIEDLYDLRKESIAKEGEYALGNLIFKEFRNKGYLDNLKELRKREKSKELSLEESGDDSEAKLDDTDRYVIKRYRDYLGLDDDYEITEENLDEDATHYVSANNNYDIYDLKELLIKRGNGKWQ